MKQLFAPILMLFLAAFALTSCKETTPEPNPDPKPEVTYDYAVKALHTVGMYSESPELPGLAQYDVVLAEMEVSQNMAYSAEGLAISLTLFAKPNEKMLLAAGTYTYSNATKPIEKMMSMTSQLVIVGSDLYPSKYIDFAEATTEVSVADDVLTIVVDGKSSDGKTIHGTFTGKIQMVNVSGGGGDIDDQFPPLLKDISTTFVNAKALYFGVNNDGVGQFQILLADYDINDPYALGADINMELYSEILDGNKMPVAGKYTVGSDPTAGSLAPGYVNSTQQDAGTRAINVELEDGQNKLRYGFATSGTVEIAVSGDTYTFTVDLTAKNGKTIKGTYQGELTVQDRSFHSTLTEEKIIDLTGMPCRAQFFGQMFQSLDIDGQAWMLSILSGETGSDGLQLFLIAPATGKFEEGLPVGTYNIAREYNTGDFLCLPGEFDAGQLFFSWYVGGLEGGAATQIAPFMFGEVAVTKSGDTYTIKCEAIDDSPLENLIDATWVGKITDYSDQRTNAPAAIPAMLKSSVRAKALPVQQMTNLSRRASRVR